ncbi:MAG: NTP transferase domain-containing protein, partial [Bacteroidia bacterium]|nr:NTP transferase domain-containing protein [Bacteroidia bacterium]
MPVHIAHNTTWESGMSTSIHLGLEVMERMYPDLAAVVILVCDQPWLDSSLLDAMIRLYRADSQPIVAAEYQGIAGVPVLFDRFFLQLFTISGEIRAPGKSCGCIRVRSRRYLFRGGKRILIRLRIMPNGSAKNL